MQQPIRMTLSGAIIVLALIGGGAMAAPACLAPTTADNTAIVTGINRMRAQRGLTPVRANGALAHAAAGQSCRQARANRLTHEGAGGVGQRVRQAGYAAGSVAENVAAGQVGVAGAQQMWAASAPHLANMMNPRMRDVGIAQTTAADGRTRYWTLVLAAPR